ncbi:MULTISPECIES: GNAT family N-acetyltransferase [unclassified Nostoc]|uniref:GNAT family N-acetyltransferase n=1 Tax=unclassified Nostoc TaxID=2593658 RepID=UPI0026137D90|nr:GNAT family N-acetyltransferase [Nostoc sp. S13]MDF5735708.1 GNAT family N-acetyltransferase [Nostoc sp. S13]
MISLTIRSYEGETDLQSISDLLKACEAVDKLNQEPSVSELRQASDDPSLDKVRDIRLWEDPDGKLIGIGHLGISRSDEAIDGSLSCRVHPSARSGNLERQIITWGEERMREVQQDQGVHVKLRASARDDKAGFIALLESSGFKSERCLLTMTRSLKEPITEPQLPANFTLRQVRDQQDAEAWVEMYNQSLIDDCNHHPLTVEHYKYLRSHPTYRPDLDLVAIAPDGTFAGCCECAINPDSNTRTGHNEGWVSQLGTRRGFRRIGLGRAMLLSGMRQLQAAGADMAKLSVYFNNPNGALQLYESVGFYKLYTWISYVKYV